MNFKEYKSLFLKDIDSYMESLLINDDFFNEDEKEKELSKSLLFKEIFENIELNEDEKVDGKLLKNIQKNFPEDFQYKFSNDIELLELKKIGDYFILKNKELLYFDSENKFNINISYFNCIPPVENIENKIPVKPTKRGKKIYKALNGNGYNYGGMCEKFIKANSKQEALYKLNEWAKKNNETEWSLYKMSSFNENRWVKIYEFTDLID